MVNVYSVQVVVAVVCNDDLVLNSEAKLFNTLFYSLIFLSC